MKASKKYMFQKIKFLLNNKCLIKEIYLKQTVKSIKTEIQTVKERSIFIELNQYQKKKKKNQMIKKKIRINNLIKKQKVWHHYYQV